MLARVLWPAVVAIVQALLGVHTYTLHGHVDLLARIYLLISLHVQVCLVFTLK